MLRQKKEEKKGKRKTPHKRDAGQDGEAEAMGLVCVRLFAAAELLYVHRECIAAAQYGPREVARAAWVAIGRMAFRCAETWSPCVSSIRALAMPLRTPYIHGRYLRALLFCAPGKVYTRPQERERDTMLEWLCSPVESRASGSDCVCL